MSIKGYPVSSVASIVYEPAISPGGYIVTIKYEYHINVVIDGTPPYGSIIRHKKYSRQLTTELAVDEYIGSQLLSIHKKYPTVKITGIDVTHKES